MDERDRGQGLIRRSASAALRGDTGVETTGGGAGGHAMNDAGPAHAHRGAGR